MGLKKLRFILKAQAHLFMKAKSQILNKDLLYRVCQKKPRSPKIFMK